VPRDACLVSAKPSLAFILIFLLLPLLVITRQRPKCETAAIISPKPDQVISHSPFVWRPNNLLQLSAARKSKIVNAISPQLLLNPETFHERKKDVNSKSG
jgi:hypothetical protein